LAIMDHTSITSVTTTGWEGKRQKEEKPSCFESVRIPSFY
jgi:hypothetical protein